MALSRQRAEALLAELRRPEFAHLFAQAHARHVLHEVKESPENFPSFDASLDDKVTYAAYSLMAAACSLLERGERSGAAPALETAASLLLYVHGPGVAAQRPSAFHVLVAAMAFYAAGQYSRAYVALKGAAEQTAAGGVISAFIRKDSASLIAKLNAILLAEPPDFDDDQALDEHAITTAIARAVSLATDFTFSGDEIEMDRADVQLGHAAEIAAAGDHAAWWLMVRLLRLMLGDLRRASPWTVLPPRFSAGSTDLVNKYVRLLAFGKHPVNELWISQREALPLALDPTNRGAVINLRTSAGKTRIAELAILQTLAADPSARVLYLAPFRSLAIEVEHTLEGTFRHLGFGVSHLYGGSRVSSVDAELASESPITIATPEKAKALFRAAPELFENLRLIIVDEGHLLGESERDVRNEIFVDHLRALAHATGSRVLLLSAVLPNPQEFAEWITGDPRAVVRSPWKPSAERFGILKWDGSRARIDWMGAFASFNPAFVEKKSLVEGKRGPLFPKTKSQAVAASAVRLSEIGPVMIFAGQAQWVASMAEAVLTALGSDVPPFQWPQHEWRVLEAVCAEEMEPDSLLMRAARAGVICHSTKLTPQVRLAIEYLMRARAPRIIVATSTLGQGVNVGISSVIVSTPYIGKQERIAKRDFRNICGRAGRAFVDGEGKVLFAVDGTGGVRKSQQGEELAREYFDAAANDPVSSGLLVVVEQMRAIAAKAGVSFPLLLQLAAENDFSRLGSDASTCEEFCDLLDDELLALLADPNINPDNDDAAALVERVFRNSLAAVQARSPSSSISVDEMLSFLTVRARAALVRVPAESRAAIIASGLPLKIALRTLSSIELFAGVARQLAADDSLDVVCRVVGLIEEWARGNCGAIVSDMPGREALEKIRPKWLAGLGLRELSALDEDAPDVVRDLYGYQLPWIIHAASQQLRAREDTEYADILADLALVVELGVPGVASARIFLAGVHSRVSATELAQLDVAYGESVSDVRRLLRDPEFVASVRPAVSQPTRGWLDLIVTEAKREWSAIPPFPKFTVSVPVEADTLHARTLGSRTFLCAVDGEFRIDVTGIKGLPFERVANNPRVVFVRSAKDWVLQPRDPRVQMAKE